MNHALESSNTLGETAALGELAAADADVSWEAAARKERPRMYSAGYMNPVFALMGAAYAVAWDEGFDSAS